LYESDSSRWLGDRRGLALLSLLPHASHALALLLHFLPLHLLQLPPRVLALLLDRIVLLLRAPSLVLLELERGQSALFVR
jgi:hypothetical protein